MVFFAAGEFSVPILVASGLVRVKDETVAQSSILPSVPQFDVEATTNVVPVAHALATELPKHVCNKYRLPLLRSNIFNKHFFCAIYFSKNLQFI